MFGSLDEQTEDDDLLASFIESEILSTSSENPQQQQQEEKEKEPHLCEDEQREVVGGRSIRPNQHHQHDTKKRKDKDKKKRHLEPEDVGDEAPRSSRRSGKAPRLPHHGQIDIGVFSKIPPELFHHILKFLSSEDLISCSLVCRLMNFAASDESLWRRLYCLRWGLSSPAGKLHTCPWKRLYIQRDEEDMVEFIKNTPSEFREYYIQMQTAKRSRAPLLSQVNDDHMILDKTVADQVSLWKRKRGLTDDAVIGHVCSGNTCTYSQIGDVFLCEKTGRVHVCDDTCREVVLDPSSGILVCTISGHCFDRLLSPEEELDVVMLNSSFQEQQGVATDEAEPFMGSGRFARAYLLGYSCADEKELEAALRFC